VLFVVLGVGYYVVTGALSAIVATRTDALSALVAAHKTLTDQGQEYQAKVAACRSTADTLSCIEAADRDLADAFDGFAGKVDSVNFPTAEASAAAADVERLAHDLASALRQLATATSEEAYASQATNLNSLGTTFDQEYETLVQALTS
jgi:hypothetical protein